MLSPALADCDEGGKNSPVELPLKVTCSWPLSSALMVSGDPGIVPTVAARAGAAPQAIAAAHAAAAAIQRTRRSPCTNSRTALISPRFVLQRPASLPLATTTPKGSGKLHTASARG